MRLDYFKIADESCRKDAERIRRGEQWSALHFPMARAAVCISCSEIFLIDNSCPACADTQVMPLATWLDRIHAKDTP